LKAYSKGEHVLRVEAITHNRPDLGCGRVLDRWAEITNRLAGMADRFCTALDCVDVAFVPDGILDQLPEPSQLGASRVSGIDLNKTRIRHALRAVLALAVSNRPDGSNPIFDHRVEVPRVITQGEVQNEIHVSARLPRPPCPQY
jgi:hypothetical protein